MAESQSDVYLQEAWENEEITLSEDQGSLEQLDCSQDHFLMELFWDVAVNGFRPPSAPDADGLSAGLPSHGDLCYSGRIGSSNTDDSAMTSSGGLFGMNMTESINAVAIPGSPDLCPPCGVTEITEHTWMDLGPEYERCHTMLDTCSGIVSHPLHSGASDTSRPYSPACKRDHLQTAAGMYHLPDLDFGMEHGEQQCAPDQQAANDVYQYPSSSDTSHQFLMGLDGQPLQPHQALPAEPHHGMVMQQANAEAMVQKEAAENVQQIETPADASGPNLGKQPTTKKRKPKQPQVPGGAMLVRPKAAKPKGGKVGRPRVAPEVGLAKVIAANFKPYLKSKEPRAVQEQRTASSGPVVDDTEKNYVIKLWSPRPV